MPVLLLAIALGLGACSDGDGAAPGPTPPTPSPTAAPSPTPGPTEEPGQSPEPTEEPTAEPSPGLDDGRHFGFVQVVDPEGMTLVLDLAYFLTGEEANEAAAERGDEVPVPNDYYIVNDNPKLRTLALSPDVGLRLIDWNRCCELSLNGDLETFAAAIASGEPIAAGGSVYYGGWSPYWLEIEDGRVVLIEEQYLP